MHLEDPTTILNGLVWYIGQTNCVDVGVLINDRGIHVTLADKSVVKVTSLQAIYELLDAQIS